MTISYSLAPVPKWYIADMVGRPLGGGYLATFNNLDQTTLRPVYQDPAGVNVWPYITIPNVDSLGILFDENGSQGPFYFKFDTAAPEQLYYLEVYDSDGVLQWTINNFGAPGSSGGSVITEARNLDNIVINPVFWRNFGTTPVTTTTQLFLAPSAHAALANNIANSAGTYTGPDIYFVKNNTSATDTISFPKFILGTHPLTGDVTPVDYLNYTCSLAGTGETRKCIQIPITQGVQNLSNNDVTVTLWGRGNSGTTSITMQWFQFFGDGAGASPIAITPIVTQALTSSWSKIRQGTTVPDVTGDVLGGCGNDGLFLQIELPHDAVCNIDLTKPCLYVNTISPDEEYVSYDMIDAVINAPRISDVKLAFATSALPGYVAMNDGSIGSAASVATTRANIDTFPLFNLLWNNVSDAWAPVSTGRGASAVADFTANKRLTLTRVLGRAISGAGFGFGLTNRALGEFLGAETHTLTIAEMPAHQHRTWSTGLGADQENVGINGRSSPNDAGTSSATGGGNPHTIMQPSAFMNVFIKL